VAVIFDQPFQILLNLAREKKIDPWDVDIDKVANLYAERIRRRRKLDLRISGRALFSASTLLRMKADNPPFDGNGEAEEELLEEFDFEMMDLGSVSLYDRGSQQITLSDLASSLREALEKSESRSGGKERKVTVEDVVWEIDDYHLNIEDHIEEFHEKISMLVKPGERVDFVQLLPTEDEVELCRNLLLALFLSSRGKVALHQEEHFAEIYIELLEPAGDGDGG